MESTSFHVNELVGRDRDVTQQAPRLPPPLCRVRLFGQQGTIQFIKEFAVRADFVCRRVPPIDDRVQAALTLVVGHAIRQVGSFNNRLGQIVGRARDKFAVHHHQRLRGDGGG